MPKLKTPARGIAKPAAVTLPKIPAWLPELEQWERAPYDGIKGCPPAWVPEPHRKQFGLARRCLFFLVEEKKVSYAEIRSRFDYLIKEKYGAIALAIMKDPRHYDDHLQTLLTIYKANQLDEEEGLRQLAGETAVVGYRALTGYRKRADVVDRAQVQRWGRPTGPLIPPPR